MDLEIEPGCVIPDGGEAVEVLAAEVYPPTGQPGRQRRFYRTPDTFWLIVYTTGHGEFPASAPPHRAGEIPAHLPRRDG